MIFYTNNGRISRFFIPERFAACTRGPFIFIREEYKNDRGLLEHEKIHRWQWIRTVGLHSFLYLVSKKYRLKAEVEAYKKQLEYSPNHIDLFAYFIATKYNLNITKEDALKLLK